MHHWTPDDVRVHVYTFKQGLLSAVGHDLLLEASAEVDEDGDQLVATVRTGSLHTVCAMRKGERVPGALSDKDKAEIDRNLRRSVLPPERFPTVRFTTTHRTPELLTGTLDLHGASRPLRIPVRRVGDRRVGTVELDQREWGIEPFSALLGALKVQPVVRVEVSLPVVGP
jgi:hypothetical protein